MLWRIVGKYPVKIPAFIVSGGGNRSGWRRYRSRSETWRLDETTVPVQASSRANPRVVIQEPGSIVCGESESMAGRCFIHDGPLLHPWRAAASGANDFNTPEQKLEILMLTDVFLTCSFVFWALDRHSH
jgi:hypothetical protein